MKLKTILAAAAAMCAVAAYGQKTSGNPIFEGRYADPEGVVFGDTYWIYPTYSAPYDEQQFFDAFSSKDLVKWTKHERIIDSSRIKWLRRALWAPAAIEKDGRYYLFFGANDVHEGEIGGIGVAVADNPAGPFEDYLGKPLIGEIINGAQPIDQYVFEDRDGTLYMYYGGWRHCNVAKLRDDLRGFVPFEDGETFKEVTPEGYVEGPFMFIRDGKYYFMWSEGGWTGPDYRVAYAVSDNPLGPFVRKGVILRTDENVATGAGHHRLPPPPARLHRRQRPRDLYRPAGVRRQRRYPPREDDLRGRGARQAQVRRFVGRMSAAAEEISSAAVSFGYVWPACVCLCPWVRGPAVRVPLSLGAGSGCTRASAPGCGARLCVCLSVPGCGARLCVKFACGSPSVCAEPPSSPVSAEPPPSVSAAPPPLRGSLRPSGIRRCGCIGTNLSARPHAGGSNAAP